MILLKSADVGVVSPHSVEGLSSVSDCCQAAEFNVARVQHIQSTPSARGQLKTTLITVGVTGFFSLIMMNRPSDATS
jgi:hypothetical protein